MNYAVAWYVDNRGVVATIREDVFGSFSTRQYAIDCVTEFFKRPVTFIFI